MNIFMIHPHDLLTAPWTIRIIKFAESLVRRGHQVTIAYFPSSERRRNGHFVRKTLPSGPLYMELKSRKWNIFNNLRQVCQSSKDADVIHVQKCFSDAVLPALYAARLYGKPLHYDWDDNESLIAEDWEPRYFLRKEIGIYERMLPRLSTTISVASSALQELALEYGACAEHIFAAPVGADLDEFDTLKTMACTEYPSIQGIDRWILYVGQLEGANYASILVKAFAGIARCRSDVGLLIVGGGYGKAQLEIQIRELNLTDRAFITGYVSHSHIPSIMAKADVAVACLEDTPNARAKSPLKVVEYLAAGPAVVGSAVGEVIKMLDGCGLLVPPGDVGFMQNAILELIDNPDKRRELREKARTRVETVYNWDNSADNIMLAYEKGIRLMKGRG